MRDAGAVVEMLIADAQIIRITFRFKSFPLIILCPVPVAATQLVDILLTADAANVTAFIQTVLAHAIMIFRFPSLLPNVVTFENDFGIFADSEK